VIDLAEGGFSMIVCTAWQSRQYPFEVLVLNLCMSSQQGVSQQKSGGRNFSNVSMKEEFNCS